MGKYSCVGPSVCPKLRIAVKPSIKVGVQHAWEDMPRRYTYTCLVVQKQHSFHTSLALQVKGLQLITCFLRVCMCALC